MRRAEQSALSTEDSLVIAPVEDLAVTPEETPARANHGRAVAAAPPVRLNIHPGMLSDVVLVPFQPAPESHLLDLNNSHETPAEEFRTLRTRLNHLQTLQPLHTVDRHQSFARRREDVLGGQSGAGAGAPGRKRGSAGGLRPAPSDRPQPVSDGPRRRGCRTTSRGSAASRRRCAAWKA